MKIKKICFVGFGSHVEKTILPSLSLDKKNIKIISSKSSIKNFDTFPDIKSALKIISKDYVIYNATPPKLHFITSKLVLNMGFNLIVEINHNSFGGQCCEHLFYHVTALKQGRKIKISKFEV